MNCQCVLEALERRALLTTQEMGFNDEVTQVILDAQGNSYVTGTFSNTVDFDPGPGIATLADRCPDSPLTGGPYSRARTVSWPSTIPPALSSGLHNPDLTLFGTHRDLPGP